MLRFVFLVTQSEPIGTLHAASRDAAQRFSNGICASIYETGALDNSAETFEACLEEIKEADFVFFRIHGTISSFHGFRHILPLLGERKMFFHSGMEEENREMSGCMNLYPAEYRAILRYYNNADAESLTDMIGYIAEEILQAGEFVHEPPRLPVWHGLYGLEEGQTEQMLLDAVRDCAHPVVGILVHWHNYSQNDMAHVDALMNRLRALDAVPVCAYSQIVPDAEMGFGGVSETLRRYFLRDGKPVIGCLLNLTSFSVSVLANPGDGSAACEHSVFEQLDVPVLQAMTTTYDYEDWDKAAAGLHPATLSYSVFQPEFDGQLITYPFAYTHQETGDGQIRTVSLPIPERVDRLCRLAVNWAKLARIPMKEKKIAVILHNLPPRNDTIGCASGLDTPASVFRMVEDWREKGLRLERPFRDTQINPGRVSYEKEGQTWVPLYRAGGRPASSSACWQLGPRRAWGFPSYLRPFQGPTGPAPACLRGHAAPRWTAERPRLPW